MGLSRQQVRLLMEVYAVPARVWRNRRNGAWTILDNASEGEGDESVHPRTAASLIQRGLVRFTPHHSNRDLDWVELTDAGDREVGKYITAQIGDQT